jgi:murein hydrolase activator
MARLDAAQHRPVRRRGLPRAVPGIRVAVFALAASGLLAALPVTAQTLGQNTGQNTGRKMSPDDARSQRDANSFQLDEIRRRQNELSSDVVRLREERAQINARLIETGDLIKQSEAQLTVIEQRTAELDIQEALIRGSLEQKHGSIATLLAAMQRMGRNPPPVMVTRPEDALSMVRSAMLLSYTFPEMRSQALALADQLNSLVSVMTNIRTEGEKLKTETARLSDARTKLASLMETKRLSLAERQDELAQVRKAATEISRSVTDLNELIGKLDKAVSEKTNLGAYEKQLEADAAKQAAVIPAPAPATVPAGSAETEVAAAVPPAAKPKAVIEVQPSITLAPGDKLAMAAPGRIQPAIPFATAKGRLPLPAQGRRVLSFGEKTQTSRSQGIVIETRHGAQITAPNDGWIMYAGEFRSYGQILIINGGGGYNVLLAGLSQIDVQVGQFVLAGEPIGTMSAASKSLQAKSQDNAPVLYVEFRKDQRPIDPDPWWADSTRKVQG